MIPDGVRSRDLVGYGRNPPGLRLAGRSHRRRQPRAGLRGGIRGLGALGRRRQRGLGRVRRLRACSRRGATPARRRTTSTAAGRASGGWRASSTRRGVPVTVSAAAVALELNPAVPPGCASAVTTCSATAGAGSRCGTCRATRSASTSVAPSRPTSACSTSDRRVELPVVAERVDARPPGRGRRLPLRLRRVRRRRSLLRVRRRRAVSRRALFEDVQRQPLPHEPRIREPARLPRHARDGPRRAGARAAAPAMMTVAVHARWSGQAARAAVMREFLAHALAKPGVSVHAPPRHRTLVAGAVPAAVERLGQPPSAREKSAAASTRLAAAASSRSSNRKRGAETLIAATTRPDASWMGAAAATRPGSNSSRTIAKPCRRARVTAAAAVPTEAEGFDLLGAEIGDENAPGRRRRDRRQAAHAPGRVQHRRRGLRQDREHHVALPHRQMDALAERGHELAEHRPCCVEQAPVGRSGCQAEHPPAQAIAERPCVALDVAAFLERLQRTGELTLVAADELAQPHDPEPVGAIVGSGERLEHGEAPRQRGCPVVQDRVPASSRNRSTTIRPTGWSSSHASG